MIQWQGGLLFDLAQYKAGSHTIDTINTGQFLQQEALVMFHVWHHDGKHVVGIIACDQCALQYFGHLADGLIETI